MIWPELQAAALAEILFDPVRTVWQQNHPRWPGRPSHATVGHSLSSRPDWIGDYGCPTCASAYTAAALLSPANTEQQMRQAVGRRPQVSGTCRGWSAHAKAERFLPATLNNPRIAKTEANVRDRTVASALRFRDTGPLRRKANFR